MESLAWQATTSHVGPRGGHDVPGAGQVARDALEATEALHGTVRGLPLPDTRLGVGPKRNLNAVREHEEVAAEQAIIEANTARLRGFRV